MLQIQTEELGKRHKVFKEAIEERLSIEDVRNEFINLGKLKDINLQLEELKDIEQKLENISESMLGVHDIKDTVKQVKEELLAIKSEMNKKNEEDKPTGVFGNLFGNRK